MATLLQYSCLENPHRQGAWWATAHGVAKSQTQLSDSHTAHVMKPPQKSEKSQGPRGSELANTPMCWDVHPSTMGTDTPALRTLPCLTLSISSSLAFIIPFNI